MENKDYSEIIGSIKKKLSGDRKKDVKMLHAMAKKFREHALGADIVAEIGRMLYELTPESLRNEFRSAIDQDLKKRERDKSKAKEFLKQGELDEAESIVEPYLKMFDAFSSETVDSLVFSFNEAIEMLYYVNRYKPEKNVEDLAIVDPEMFLLAAYICIEREELDKAQGLLDKGLMHNPLDTRLLFEKGELHKLRAEWDDFEKITRFCLECSYRAVDIARAYRNYGFYLIEREDYDGAVCCYLQSGRYEDNPMIPSQLFYITQKTKKALDLDHYGTNLKAMFEERAIPLTPSVEILEICAYMVKKAEGNADYETALYFYFIMHEITQHERILERIKAMENLLAGKNISVN